MVDEELGEHEEVLCARELLTVVRRELEDRVDLQRLQPGRREEVLLSDPLEHGPVAGGARVAVGDGWLDELPAPVEQPVVDAPGVDADGREWTGLGRELEPAFGLGDQA